MHVLDTVQESSNFPMIFQPHMLCLKTKEALYPHASKLSIDTSRGRSLPGVWAHSYHHRNELVSGDRAALLQQAF